ncbi:MAG: YceI family protein [Chthoniobacterales bacterium]
MRRWLFLLIAVAVMAQTYGRQTFKIDRPHSTIAFKVRHLLGTARGNFSKFSGAIVVDREHPDQSLVTVRIDASSIDTGIAKRDEHLRTQLFNVERYPEITFKSRRVTRTGADSADVVGDLTMHGVTREITLNVQLLLNDGSHWRVTTPPLRRSQFGLMFSKSAEVVSGIADDVAVDIEIGAERDK